MRRIYKPVTYNSNSGGMKTIYRVIGVLSIFGCIVLLFTAIYMKPEPPYLIAFIIAIVIECFASCIFFSVANLMEEKDNLKKEVRILKDRLNQLEMVNKTKDDKPNK